MSCEVYGGDESAAVTMFPAKPFSQSKRKNDAILGGKARYHGFALAVELNTITRRDTPRYFWVLTAVVNIAYI